MPGAHRPQQLQPPPLRPREIRAANPFSVACGAITRFDAKINAEYFFIPGCAPDVRQSQDFLDSSNRFSYTSHAERRRFLFISPFPQTIRRTP
jgi:hypothetical protein